MARQLSRQLDLEQLEDRSVPAVIGGATAAGLKWSFDDVANKLVINGTSGADKIKLNAFGDGGKIQISDGKAIYQQINVKTSADLKIEVNGLGGNDNLESWLSDTQAKSVTLRGGDGNDQILGGTTGFGGSGNDTILWTKVQFGGSGNDSLYLGQQMYGEAGDDRIGIHAYSYSDPSSVIAIGGSGRDHFNVNLDQVTKSTTTPATFLSWTTDFDEDGDDTAEGWFYNPNTYQQQLIWQLS